MTTDVPPRHPSTETPAYAALGRCCRCRRTLAGSMVCPGCGSRTVEAGGVVEAIGALRGANRVCSEFYDGAAWRRFRFWEDVFLWFQGPGVAASRRQVLRHLRVGPGSRVLEVGIGDGANVPLLPAGCEVFGVDVARGRLWTCLSRFPATAGRLAWAEAEDLPFADGVFDAVLTVGGINYFNDPGAALREMRRVARTGAVLVAADEIAELHRFSPASLLGLEPLDRAGLRLMGLDREFLRLVYEAAPGAVGAAAGAAWPGHRRVPIWNRFGYCLVAVN